MSLRVEKVLNSSRKVEIREIYERSFPKEERMPFFMMLGMSCLWNTQFLSFYDGETLCGLAYLAAMGRQTFLMFFAVEENIRSLGYGGRILEQIQALHPKNKIIVSIEPCGADAEYLENRVRRKAFYLRNGYKETGYFMKLAGQEQEILIKNGLFSKRGFTAFMALYSFCAAIPRVWEAGGKERL